ncbi:arylamine N-acetyltransferase 1 [Massariosphaeria phaeospora]|uniref:Arylamine N-acetyltransferase 1 n=1 Tax=Massariosphaeria phaeospora TaxID=100035 RepID=A0A7C8I1S9_9PLEO|nr:arylamine N-acetyltransferase 1 [Massariosphaeria phaeospora]
MSSNNTRPVYSRDQLTQYFERLKIPEKQREYEAAGLKHDEALAYLTLLQQRHLVEIPFENLTLHYSAHRQVNIHPQELFKKIISDDNARGGYCMENNCLFGTLLYSLGFQIFSAGARVNSNGTWTGWGHMVNIITINGIRYQVDVGFGGPGPIVPMPLERSGSIRSHIEPASSRLQWRNIHENNDPDQRLWVYDHRINEKSDWTTIYCFTELEFLPSDYATMNYFSSTSPRTFFTRTIIGEKKIVGENGGIVGQLILGNTDLKWRIKGKKEKEIQFHSEDDRVNALEEHFGIKLSQVEREGIRGLASEISNKPHGV